MGSEDYLFLTPVRKLVKNQSNSKLFVIPNCGHVVNVENPSLFNDKMLSFIKSKY